MSRKRLTLLAASLLVAPTCSGRVLADDLRTEVMKLTSSDGTGPDRFGSSAGFDGMTAIVGSPGHDAGGVQNLGAAYLFDGVTGAELGKLLPPSLVASTNFGSASAVSGNTAIVGAPFDGTVAPKAGAAYLYDTATGQLLFQLLASDAAEGDDFGFSVAVDGTTAIVGAPFTDDNGDASGSAYIFDTATGQQLLELQPSDGAENDAFGLTVAVDGSLVVVGAHAPAGPGKAYVFDKATGSELGKLTASDGQAGDLFGYSVAIRGNQIVVGAPGDDDSRGAAYVFDTVSLQEVRKLVAVDRTSGDDLGSRVAVDGDIAFVGAPNKNYSQSRAGASYSFDLTDGHQIAKLVSSAPKNVGRLGFSVAMFGTRGLAGADGDNGGTAYFFALEDDQTPPSEVSELQSTSHSIGVWHRHTTLWMSWSPAIDDGLGLDGYSVLVDQHPSTVPPLTISLEEDVTEHPTLLASSAEGYYFHIRASDICGNWSDGVHLGPYFIDFLQPSPPTDLASTTHEIETWSNVSEVALEWTAATDAHSGVAGYALSVSAEPELPDGEQALDDVTEVLVALEDGDSQFINLRTVDLAANWVNVATTIGPFRIDGAPPANGTITVAGGAASTSNLIVDLNGLAATETLSGLMSMQFSNDGFLWSPPELYSSSRSGWDLSSGGGNAFVGTKTVHARFIDAAGNVSPVVTDTIDFQPGQPEIDTITPNRGPGTGGNQVTILGSGFTEDCRVLFGGTPGAVTFVNSGELRVVVPGRKATSSKQGNRGLAGEAVDVEVRTDYGRGTKKAGYTYSHRR